MVCFPHFSRQTVSCYLHAGRKYWWLGLIISLLSLIFTHYDTVGIANRRHFARTQFEHGLVQSLTQQHIVHHKPWSHAHELCHTILGRWKLNNVYFESKAHYPVIWKFFRDIKRQKRNNEMGIHGMTLVIRDMLRFDGISSFIPNINQYFYE